MPTTRQKQVFSLNKLHLSLCFKPTTILHKYVALCMAIYIYVNSDDGKYDIKLNGINWFSNKFDRFDTFQSAAATRALLIELHFDQFST